MLIAPYHPKTMLIANANKPNTLVVDDVHVHWNTTLDDYEGIGRGDGPKSSSDDESYSRNDDAIGHKQVKVVVLNVMTTTSNVPKLI
jgi:hypothetical protein